MALPYLPSQSTAGEETVDKTTPEEYIGAKPNKS